MTPNVFGFSIWEMELPLAEKLKIVDRVSLKEISKYGSVL